MFKKGQVIRVTIARRLDLGPEHYGVYDGNGGVYHFTGKSTDSARIVHTSLSEFATGGSVYPDSKIDENYYPEEIIARASSQLGTKFGGYDLFFNNCEHFASWCVSGVRQSIQTGYVNNDDDERDIVEKGLDNIFRPLILLEDQVRKIFGSGDYQVDDNDEDYEDYEDIG